MKQSKNEKKKSIKALKKSGIAMAIAVLLAVTVLPARSAVRSWTEDTQSDFGRGSFLSATSTAVGDIVLSRNKTFFGGSASFARNQAVSTGTLSQLVYGGTISLGESHTYTPLTVPGYIGNPQIDNGNRVNHSYYSPASGLLLVSTDFGLTVIDTKKTINTEDDEWKADYSTANGVLNISDIVHSSFYDDALGLIFAVTEGDGVVVIDPAIQPASSGFVTAYFSGKVNSAFLNRDSGEALLYASTDTGLYIIDIGIPADGETGTPILRLSDTNTDPIQPVFQSQSANIAYQSVNSAWLIDSATSSILFINTNKGISEVALGGKTKDEIASTTAAFLINNFLVSGLETDSAGNEITASSSAKLAGQNVYSSFFDGSSGRNLLIANTASGITIVDLGAVETSGDEITLENIVSTASAQNLIANDPSTSMTISPISLSEGFVVSGSVLSDGKLYIGNTDGDMNGSLISVSLGDILSPSDDSLSATYDASSTPALAGNAIAGVSADDGNIYISTNEGLTVIHEGKFNSSGSYLSGPITVSPSAYFTAIDADITASADQTAVVASRYGDGEGNWTDWQIGSDLTGIYTASSTVFEYKITLATQSSATSPVVNSVTLYHPYQIEGNYDSMVYDAASTMIWKSISLVAENTTNTSVKVQTRTGSTITPDGQWSQWSDLVDGINIYSPNGRYFQYRLILNSGMSDETPVINSVTVSYEDVPAAQTTTTTTNTTTSTGNTTQSTQTTTSQPPIQTATSTQVTTVPRTTATTTSVKTPVKTEQVASKVTAQGQIKGVKVSRGIIEIMAAEAQILDSGDVSTVLVNSGKKRSIIAEFENYFKFVKNIFKAEKKLTEDNLSGILNFMVYGTETTRKMSVGDRTNILNTYRDAYASSPKTDANWLDVLKMSNGQAPSRLSKKAEDKAKLNFKIVYKRNPDMKNANDALAVKIMAYGIYTPARNLKAEAEAVKKFKKTYGYQPKNFSSWNVVRGIAYSGIKK